MILSYEKPQREIKTIEMFVWLYVCTVYTTVFLKEISNEKKIRKLGRN